jgi:hypothetical protein
MPATIIFFTGPIPNWKTSKGRPATLLPITCGCCISGVELGGIEVEVGGRGVIVGGKGDAVADGWGVIEGAFEGVSEISIEYTPALLRVTRANPPAAIIAVIQSNNTNLERPLRVDINN